MPKDTPTCAVLNTLAYKEYFNFSLKPYRLNICGFLDPQDVLVWWNEKKQNLTTLFPPEEGCPFTCVRGFLDQYTGKVWYFDKIIRGEIEILPGERVVVL